MKILVFSESYIEGGLSDQIMQLFEVLNSSGYEITLALNKDNVAWGAIQRDSRLVDVTVWYNAWLTPGSSPKGILRTLKSALVQFFEFPLLNCFRRRQLKTVLSPRGYDLVIVANGGFPGGLYCIGMSDIVRKADGKRIIWIHNLFSSKAFRYSPPWFESNLPSSLQAATIVAPSKAVIDSLQKFAPDSSFRVVPNCVREVPGIKRGLTSIKRPLTVLCASAYTPQKGQEDLILATKNLLDLETHIQVKFHGVGDASFKRKLHDIASRFGVDAQMSFAGFEYEKAKLYEGVDILVLPSRSFESFGLVLVEAMSLGIPVIGTNVGGVPSVIGSRASSLLYEPSDVGSLTKILFSLCQNADAYNYWSRYFLQRYRSEFQVEAFEDKVRELVRAE